MFEAIATRLNPKMWMLANTAVLGIFLGIIALEAGGEFKRLGFCLVALGIWCGGLSVFSELFAKKEPLLEGGEYRLVSKVEAAGPAKALLAKAFFSLWFVGLASLTAMLVGKLLS